MNSKGRITVITVTDNHYLILLAALLKSIESNHESEEIIDLNIIGDHISETNKNKFNSSFANKKLNIIWHDMKEVIPENIKLTSDKTSYPINIYMRLFFPSFISEEVERVLYLDVDMIMLSDVSKLFYSDLKNYPVGAVLDPKIRTFNNTWGGIKNYNELGLNGESAYFNTGMLLIDVQKWKKLDVMQKVIDCVEQNKAHLNYPDQYALNVILADNWYHINSSWNTFAGSGLDNMPDIIHFTERKPIYKSYGYSSKYQQIFYSYLNETAWKNFEQIGEKARYMKKITNIVNKWFFSRKANVLK